MGLLRVLSTAGAACNSGYDKKDQRRLHGIQRPAPNAVNIRSTVRFLVGTVWFIYKNVR